MRRAFASSEKNNQVGGWVDEWVVEPAKAIDD